MSDHKITIDCPDCGETGGWACDDYFGRHHYGYQCNKCNKVFDSTDCDSIQRPRANARYVGNGPRHEEKER